MSALCFLLVLSAPRLLLSNLHFLCVLLPSSSGASTAVDVLVGCKYLLNMHDTSVAPALVAQEPA